MKGFRFYADLAGTAFKKGEHGFTRGYIPRDVTIERLRAIANAGIKCNVVALLLGREHRCQDGTQEAIDATFGYADSDTSLGSVSRAYLRKCRRIPEQLARQLHPRLFARLDQED